MTSFNHSHYLPVLVNILPSSCLILVCLFAVVLCSVLIALGKRDDNWQDDLLQRALQHTNAKPSCGMQSNENVNGNNSYCHSDFTVWATSRRVQTSFITF
jgi:hypothetical protein